MHSIESAEIGGDVVEINVDLLFKELHEIVNRTESVTSVGLGGFTLLEHSKPSDHHLALSLHN